MEGERSLTLGVQFGNSQRAGLGGRDGVRQVHAGRLEMGPEQAAEHIAGQACQEAGRGTQPGQGHRRVRRSATGQHPQGELIRDTCGFGEGVRDALPQDGDLARAHGLLFSRNARTETSTSRAAGGRLRAGDGRGRCRFVTGARH